MHYQHVCIESLGYAIPDEVITSDDIERRLEPLYRRLKLPEGRLELMSGIRERRLWPRGTKPSDHSIESGRKAIAADTDESIEAAMTPGPSTVRPSIGAVPLLERMRSRNVQSFVVTTSDGRLVGLVLREDLE